MDRENHILLIISALIRVTALENILKGLQLAVANDRFTAAYFTFRQSANGTLLMLMNVSFMEG